MAAMLDWDDSPIDQVRRNDTREQLVELLRSAAEVGTPLVVGTEPALLGGYYDFRLYRPPPVELAHPASPAGRAADCAGLTAATDAAADEVRRLAREAGVTLLSGKVE